MIHATQKYAVNGPFNVGTAVHPPNLGDFHLEDRNAWDHNYVFQISVEFDLEEDIPGYWYFWVRSPVSHDDAEDEDIIYRFTTADALPGSSHDAGWSW